MSPPLEPDAGPDGPPLPDNGKIISSPAVQTIMAVGFLILVTLVAFFGASFIGRNMPNPSQATYWLIELIFALLCGGAGALVGGSADVRSTLNLPGTPVQARLGGAVAMIIVGFAVASLTKPADPQEQSYSLEIQGFEQDPKVDGIQYGVALRAAELMSVTQRESSVTISIPLEAAEYKAAFVVFKGDGSSAEIFARCTILLKSEKTHLNPAMELIPESDLRFRVYLAPNYVAKVVHKFVANNKKTVIEDEPCVEGVVANERAGKKLLNGYFTLVPEADTSGLLSLVHYSSAPAYSVMASVLSADVPPQHDAPSSGSVTPVTPELTPATPPALQPQPSPPPLAASPTAPSPSTVQSFEAQVDAYVQGQNLDRTQLYQHWDQVADHVARGFRSAFSTGSPSVGRYVNLIANALSVIDNGKYLAPTLRPDSDQSAKPDRLGKKNPIPGFAADDYAKVVNLLCSDDANNRSAAQRLLRSFPSDYFYAQIQSLQNQINCQQLFVAESAVFYFYNRIVEYDGTWVLDAASVNWMDGNLSDGKNWVKLAVAKDPNHDVYGALLDFGYGLDLWDRTFDAGSRARAKPYFESMLATLGASKGVYPSNPAHIATALKELNNPGVPSKIAASATSYDATASHPVAGNYVASGASVVLFALPDTSSNQVGQVSGSGSIRIYLRADSWDFVQSGSLFGWAERTVTSAGN